VPSGLTGFLLTIDDEWIGNSAAPGNKKDAAPVPTDSDSLP
jgi:hypothetical protein